MDVNGFALVIGAGSGIGLETALTFAERGARGVAFADKNFEAAQQAVEKSKIIATSKDYQALAIQVDIIERESVAKLVKEVHQTFGRIDYAVNSAGMTSGAPAKVEDATDDRLDFLHEVNSKGMLHCIQEEILVMRGQEHLYCEGRSGRRSIGPGTIINVTSALALISLPNCLTYMASKFSARGIIKCAAYENASTGLRINEICPSWTDTPLHQGNLEKSPSLAQFVEKTVPLKRVAKVEEIAGVIHFLASPAASYITGQSLMIDAGAWISTYP